MLVPLESDRVGVAMLFSVLGPVEVRTGGGPVGFGRKPAAVLALLLLHPNGWVGPDAIVEALWPDGPPASADRNVRTYVWQLRSRLPAAAGGARIESRPGGYRIVVSAAELDALAFEELAAAARQAAGPAAVREHCLAALRLWRGTPYGDLPGDDAARIAAAGLVELRWELRQRLADALLRLGEHADAVTLLRPLAAEEPLREGLWTALVRALHRAGRRGEALAAYREAHRLLRDELGVEPGAELREAHQQALAGGSGALPRPNCLPRDLPDFVGRAAELARLREPAGRVAVVDGMPGAGKTALAVHAAHELAGSYPDGQLFVDLGPAAAPTDVLAGLLRTVGVPAADVPAGTGERAALWRSVLADRRVLLVLDDAVSAAQVAPLLPGDGRSLTLVTSRCRLAALDGVTSLSVPLLSAREALRLLGLAVGDDRVARERAAAAELVERCGRLPAAVRIAAAWLRRRPAWSVGRVVDWLAAEPGRLVTLPAEDRSLAAVFAESYRGLPPDARRMFRLLGLLDGRDVDPAGAAALAGWSPAVAEPVLDALLDAHLVTQQVAGRYGLPALLGLYAGRLAGEDPPDGRREALARLDRHRRPRLAPRTA